jgi:ketosteroid isomerase-like protein
MSAQIEIVRKYVSLVQNLEFTESTTRQLLHPEYIQWELPNILNKNGQKSNLAESFKRIETAKTILTTQKYDITTVMEQGNRVVIETIWTATMAIDAGPIKKGQQMRAFISMFFDFKDGKIHRVRNYDCFDPF